MTTEFTATQVVNERPRPRVLVYESPFSPDFSWVKSRAATFRSVESLAEVDLEEWDLIVTDHDLVKVTSNPFTTLGRREIPSRLSSFRVVNVDMSYESVIEVVAPADHNFMMNQELKIGLRWSIDVPGHISYRVGELPETLQDLVQTALLPAIEKREKQVGLSGPVKPADLVPSITQFRPFLVGPSNLIYAASYRFIGGGRHWVVPSDAGDLGAWLDCAISEWHLETPNVYPSSGAWQTSAEWMTGEELEARSRIAAAQVELTKKVAELEALKAAVVDQLESLRTSGDDGLRRLLTAKDFELQNEVFNALVHLGFEVEDMDPTWKDREHREDFRIRDSLSPDWLVLADATGSTKGAKLGKLLSLQRHATTYLIEASLTQMPPLWLFVNHLLFRDPSSRGTPFTKTDADSLEHADALAIDTVALFVLIRDYSNSGDEKRAVREWMRSRKGQLTLADATAWIEEQSGPASRPTT